MESNVEIDIALNPEEGGGFLRRLYRHLLLQTVDNPTSVEMEPDAVEETERPEWAPAIPEEIRYCTCCAVELCVGENITKHRLSIRWHICTSCKRTSQLKSNRNVAVEEIFPKRYCYRCATQVDESNCHSYRSNKTSKERLCDECRVDIREAWHESEHKCIHCVDVLVVGKNWPDYLYSQRCRVCVTCRRNQIRERNKERNNAS